MLTAIKEYVCCAVLKIQTGGRAPGDVPRTYVPCFSKVQCRVVVLAALLKHCLATFVSSAYHNLESLSNVSCCKKYGAWNTENTADLDKCY